MSIDQKDFETHKAIIKKPDPRTERIVRWVVGLLAAVVFIANVGAGLYMLIVGRGTPIPTPFPKEWFF